MGNPWTAEDTDGAAVWVLTCKYKCPQTLEMSPVCDVFHDYFVNCLACLGSWPVFDKTSTGQAEVPRMPCVWLAATTQQSLPGVRRHGG